MTLSVRYQRKRFTAGARRGRKGDKSVIPRARATKGAIFIAILNCYGEEANDIFCTVFIVVCKNTGVNGFHGLSPFTV